MSQCGVALLHGTYIGPYIFQSGGRTETVSGPRYKKMVNTFLVPELRRFSFPLHQVLFQQDGATPHTTRAVLARPRQLFPGKLISKKGDVQWPPRSPDLSPLDFFLWGHLKATVYAHSLRSLRQLRIRIRAARPLLSPPRWPTSRCGLASVSAKGVATWRACSPITDRCSKE